jgi:amino acid transporter
MRTIYKIILVNLGALIGFVAVLFTIPGDTSYTLLGFILLGTLGVINVAAFVWPRYRKSRGTEKADSKFTTIKLIAIWIIFLLGLLWNWSLWHHR